jgi:tetratricopeptide (TPR) repeat protein
VTLRESSGMSVNIGGRLLSLDRHSKLLSALLSAPGGCLSYEDLSECLDRQRPRTEKERAWASARLRRKANRLNSLLATHGLRVVVRRGWGLALHGAGLAIEEAAAVGGTAALDGLSGLSELAELGDPTARTTLVAAVGVSLSEAEAQLELQPERAAKLLMAVAPVLEAQHGARALALIGVLLAVLEPNPWRSLYLLRGRLRRRRGLAGAVADLERVLEMEPTAQQAVAACLGLAHHASARGQHAKAGSVLEVAQGWAASPDAPEYLEARLSFGRALCRNRRGDQPGALELYERAIAQGMRQGDPLVVLRAKENRALIRRDQGKVVLAYRECRLLLEEHRVRSYRDAEARALLNLASMAMLLGELEDARQLLAEAVTLNAERGHPASVATCHMNLGLVSLAEKCASDAELAFSRAEEIQRRLGLSRGLAETTLAKGMLHAAGGQVSRAKACFRACKDNGAGVSAWATSAERLVDALLDPGMGSRGELLKGTPAWLRAWVVDAEELSVGALRDRARAWHPKAVDQVVVGHVLSAFLFIGGGATR